MCALTAGAGGRGGAVCDSLARSGGVPAGCRGRGAGSGDQGRAQGRQGGQVCGALRACVCVCFCVFACVCVRACVPACRASLMPRGRMPARIADASGAHAPQGDFACIEERLLAPPRRCPARVQGPWRDGVRHHPRCPAAQATRRAAAKLLHEHASPPIRSGAQGFVLRLLRGQAHAQGVDEREDRIVGALQTLRRRGHTTAAPCERRGQGT